MTLTPPSSIPSSVTVIGTVSADVTDRAARLLGHVTVDNASLAVTGPLTDAELRASAVPVSGTVAISGTVPVTVAELPLPDGAATEESLADAVEALNDVALTAILERDRMETT